jgi:hypothetical protein
MGWSYQTCFIYDKGTGFLGKRWHGGVFVFEGLGQSTVLFLPVSSALPLGARGIRWDQGLVIQVPGWWGEVPEQR